MSKIHRKKIFLKPRHHHYHSHLTNPPTTTNTRNCHHKNHQENKHKRKKNRNCQIPLETHHKKSPNPPLRHQTITNLSKPTTQTTHQPPTTTARKSHHKGKKDTKKTSKTTNNNHIHKKQPPHNHQEGKKKHKETVDLTDNHNAETHHRQSCQSRNPPHWSPPRHSTTPINTIDPNPRHHTTHAANTATSMELLCHAYLYRYQHHTGFWVWENVVSSLRSREGRTRRREREEMEDEEN